jgi:hypothetical protein
MKTNLRDAFVASLHAEHLKPLGFKKTRHTFVRSLGEYSEHFQIQGSAWNDSQGPWTCYLNCGISFEGLPPRNPDRDFPRTHIWKRAEDFVRQARAEYKVTSRNIEATAAQLADVIHRCSEYFRRRNAVLRKQYQNEP